MVPASELKKHVGMSERRSTLWAAKVRIPVVASVGKLKEFLLPAMPLATPAAMAAKHWIVSRRSTRSDEARRV